MSLDNANKLYQKQKGNLIPTRSKARFRLDRMGGEALQRPNVPPQPCQEQEENLILT